MLIHGLAGEEAGFERLHFGYKYLSLTSQGDELLPPATGTKVLPDFVKGGTKSLRGGEGTKAEHRIVTLFDSSVVLFNGLITNDKFCLSIVSSQRLDWVRGPRAGVGGCIEPATPKV